MKETLMDQISQNHTVMVVNDTDLPLFVKSKSDSFFWVLESSEHESDKLKNIYEKTRPKNVVLSNSSLNLKKLLKLNRTCETFDFVVYPNLFKEHGDYAYEVLSVLGSMSHNTIIEYSGDISMLDRLFDTVTKIDSKNNIYCVRNYNTKKHRCVSYLNSPTGKHHEISMVSGNWFIDDHAKKYSGINFVTLKDYGLIYPDYREIIREAASRYYDLIKNTDGAVTDISPHNMILSHNAVWPIDYSESVGEYVYGKSWDQYYDEISNYTKSSIEEYLLDKWLNQYEIMEF